MKCCHNAALHNLALICNVEVIHMHTWLTMSDAEEDLKKGNFELTESNLFYPYPANV